MAAGVHAASCRTGSEHSLMSSEVNLASTRLSEDLSSESSVFYATVIASH